MKKSILFFVLFCSSATILLAQDTIPNGKFELWDSINKYWEPRQWATPNPYLSINPFNQDFVVNKADEAYQGDEAVLMETKWISWVGQNIPGAITTGQFLLNGNKVLFAGGSPFTARPDFIRGYYKYSPGLKDADSGGMALYMFKYDTVNKVRDTIGSAFFVVKDSITSFQLFEAFINYTSTENPDTLQIIFSSSVASSPVAGSKLIVDDLSFGMSIGLKEKGKQISIYPNPASGKVFVNLFELIDYEIYSLSGRIIRTGKTGNGQIDISGIKTGIYFIRIRTGKDQYFQKLLVQ